MKKIFILSVLLSASSIFAQRGGGRFGGMGKGSQMDPAKAPKIGQVYGTVIDSVSENPIPYASVSVINSRSNTILTGGITDDKGMFHVKEIALGRHKIVIEYIGYEKKELGPYNFLPFGKNQTEYNLDKISMNQTTLQMAGVDVQGERPMFIQTAEKRVFNVERNSLTKGGSAIDALRQVPGVEVDPDDNISLRGNTQVNLMIDGKPSSIAGGDIKSLLQSVPASNIADIEVMTNPGAKYDPEGMAGIINIVLKENRFAGLNGNVNSGGDTQGGTNFSGQVNFRNTKFNSFINLGMNNKVWNSDGTSLRQMEFQEFKNILEQSYDSKSNGPNLFVKTGGEYFIDPTQSLGLSFTISDGKRYRDNENYTLDKGPGESRYIRISDSDSDRGGYDFNLNYDKKFKNPKHKLTSYLRLSNGNNDGDNEYKNTEWEPYKELFENADEARNGQNGKNAGFDLQVDYVRPFESGSKIELGFSSKNNDRNDYQRAEIFDYTLNQFVNDNEFTNDFNFNETVNAAYVQYGGSYWFIGYNAGLRFEMVNMLSDLKSNPEVFKKDYNSLYPSLSFTLGAPQFVQLQASYSKRVRRPRSRQLNPFISRQDERNYRSGNPFLDPEYTDSYEINFSRFKRGLSLSFGTYYRKTTDEITRHKKVNPDGTSLASYENIGSKETKGFEYNVVGSLGKKIRLIFGGNTYWDVINTDIYGDVYDKTSKTNNFRITSTYNLLPKTELSFFMFHQPKKEIAIGTFNAMTWSNMSVKQKLMDERLNLTLNISDPFAMSGFGFYLQNDTWQQESIRNFSSRTIRLTLEYRFGKMEDKSRFSRQRRQGGMDRDNENYEID
ncbi:MAG: outer membrane beta-barrel family protein [Candidatus Neomarinimicrobiota bacterium]|nr:outer membrane beta-barrel family protein [Candidatus Neomarinimicrobiota bacterium]|tara:strand:- start:11 stop:2518 length:2508 start_codon:yes stop_codon:yes gene_type:complete